MEKFVGTIASALCATAATASASVGDNIVTYITLLIGIAITLTNAGIEIYRKIRDRDADLQKGDKKKNEK